MDVIMVSVLFLCLSIILLFINWCEKQVNKD